MSAPCGCGCPSRIYDQAQVVLDTVIAEAASCGIELPCKQVIIAGDMVHDAEQVIVAMGSISTGLPLAASQTGIPGSAYSWACAPSWTLGLQVAIVRCGPKLLPDGTSDAEAQKASALQRSRDAHLLMHVAQSIARDSIGAVPVNVQFVPRQDMVATVGIYQMAVGAPVCSHPAGV